MNVVHKVFDEDAHELVIVEDVSILYHTLLQLISVLFNGDMMLV